MTKITVQTIVNADLNKVWDFWTRPEHIMKWNHASDDWECPASKNDVRVGGKFCATMAAKDKSFSFDFEGTYTSVKIYEHLEYLMPDGRHARVEFHKISDGTKVVETFDPENENSLEMQRAGWQAILDNFKKHCEKR